MREITLKIAAFFFYSGLLFSCSNNKKDAAPGLPVIDTPKRDTGKDAKLSSGSIVSVVDTTLKNIHIDEKYYDQKAIANADIKKNIFDSLGLDEIPSLKGLQKDTASHIKIIDTLVINHDVKILLVSAATDNEQVVSLIMYDANNKMSANETVFYQDFVEYFSKTTTTVNNNKISITTETEAGDERSKIVLRYHFREGKLLEKVKK